MTSYEQVDINVIQEARFQQLKTIMTSKKVVALIFILGLITFFSFWITMLQFDKLNHETQIRFYVTIICFGLTALTVTVYKSLKSDSRAKFLLVLRAFTFISICFMFLGAIGGIIFYINYVMPAFENAGILGFIVFLLEIIFFIFIAFNFIAFVFFRKLKKNISGQVVGFKASIDPLLITLGFLAFPFLYSLRTSIEEIVSLVRTSTVFSILNVILFVLCVLFVIIGCLICFDIRGKYSNNRKLR